MSEFLQVSTEWSLAAERKPYNALVPRWSERLKAEYADAQWLVLSALPVGRALLRRPACQKLLHHFELAREKARRKWGDDPNVTELGPAYGIPLQRMLSHTARLKVLQTLALLVQAGHGGNWKIPPRRATADERESAIMHANGLLAALRNGVQVPNSYSATNLLRETLTDLVADLSERARRKQRERGQDAGRRILLSRFASHLILVAGWCQPVTLMAFSDLVGMPCNDKLAMRISKAQWAAGRKQLQSQFGDSNPEILGKRPWVTVNRQK